MATSRSLYCQLSSVMQTMAGSALSQVCKLVDEESAELRLEMSRLLSANSSLTQKVNSLEGELKIARSEADVSRSYRTIGVQTTCNTDSEPQVSGSPTIEGIFGKDWCINLWKESVPHTLEPVPESSQSFAKSMKTLTEVQEKDDVARSAHTSFQQDPLSNQDAAQHEESMPTVAEPLTVICTEGAFIIHTIPLEDEDELNVEDDDDDVQFVRESQQEPMIDGGGPSQAESVAGRPGALRVHYVVHTGEKPYRCSWGGKLFTQKGNQKCHILIYTGERPICSVRCGKTFRQKSKLKFHLAALKNCECGGEKPLTKSHRNG